MKNIIYFLSAKEINNIENYNRFYHTKAYIKQKSEVFIDNRNYKEQTKSLMAASGYNDLVKFRKHRINWNNLERSIPLKYLEAIDADLNTLKFTVELDQQEYDRALEIKLFPKSAVIRIMAAVYSDLKFPENTPETEAIEIAKRFFEEKNLMGCINFPDIKTIWIEPNGVVKKTYYRPSIKITNTLLIPSNNGKGIGMSYIA